MGAQAGFKPAGLEHVAHLGTQACILDRGDLDGIEEIILGDAADALDDGPCAGSRLRKGHEVDDAHFAEMNPVLIHYDLKLINK